MPQGSECILVVAREKIRFSLAKLLFFLFFAPSFLFFLPDVVVISPRANSSLNDWASEKRAWLPSAALRMDKLHFSKINFGISSSWLPIEEVCSADAGMQAPWRDSFPRDSFSFSFLFFFSKHQGIPKRLRELKARTPRSISKSQRCVVFNGRISSLRIYAELTALIHG